MGSNSNATWCMTSVTLGIDQLADASGSVCCFWRSDNWQSWGLEVHVPFYTDGQKDVTYSTMCQWSKLNPLLALVKSQWWLDSSCYLGCIFRTLLDYCWRFEPKPGKRNSAQEMFGRKKCGFGEASFKGVLFFSFKSIRLDLLHE